MVEVDVVVEVVEVVVENGVVVVVEVPTGGVTMVATPNIALAVGFDTSRAPSNERRNTRPNTSSRREFLTFLNSTTSSIGPVIAVPTFRVCQAHR